MGFYLMSQGANQAALVRVARDQCRPGMPATQNGLAAVQAQAPLYDLRLGAVAGIALLG